ncbi:unnamed protein product [Orchesella dallaii]|uniref:Uncharacterized protein n=1 Tax=Orchesella dallaii TaxID=48710 RepID=A0ABP1Q7X3_9HEXA
MDASTKGSHCFASERSSLNFFPVCLNVGRTAPIKSPNSPCILSSACATGAEMVEYSSINSNSFSESTGTPSFLQVSSRPCFIERSRIIASKSEFHRVGTG